jgi:hypothetical protein
VETHGIEFFPLAGDPKALMKLCVDHGMFSVSFIYEGLVNFRSFYVDLLNSCWQACIAPRDGKPYAPTAIISNPPVMGASLHTFLTLTLTPTLTLTLTHSHSHSHSLTHSLTLTNTAHYHLAEALKIPLFIAFTMPWTQTAEFPQPMLADRGWGTALYNK